MQQAAFCPAGPDVLSRLAGDLPPDAVTVVDFDGTLLLRNSTQLYLQSLRPAWLARGVLSLLELVQPWRLLPGPNRRFVYRDWLRVLLLTVLLPWSPLLWRRACSSVAAAHANAGLLRALSARPPGTVLVATYGVRFIVAPLLSAMAPGWPLAVSASFLTGYRLRRQGKAAAVQKTIGIAAIRRSVLLTDSEDDGDFLPLCHTAYLLPAEPAAEPLVPGYLPLQYMHSCKRQGENVILRTILFYDLLCLFLAYIPPSGRPVLCALGLLLFQLAFWTMYEIGNWENDCLGQRYEAQPRVPPGFERWSRRMRPRQAWVWVASLAALSACCLAADWATVPALFVALVAYLAVIRGVYAIYNRVDPKNRALLYPLMQAGKGVGLALLLPTAPVGLLLLAAVLLVRQLRYVAYRYGGTRDALNVPVNLYIPACFLFLALLLAALTPIASPAFCWTAALIVLWHLQRGRHELRVLRQHFAWLPAAGR